jgi:phosphate starvation-inducible protein PhoH
MSPHKGSATNQQKVKPSEEQNKELVYRIDREYWHCITKGVVDLLQSTLSIKIKVNKSNSAIIVQDTPMAKVAFLAFERYIIRAFYFKDGYDEAVDTMEAMASVLDGLSCLYKHNGGYATQAIPLCMTYKSEPILARSSGQDDLAMAIRIYDFVIGYGVAGSGKTTVAAAMACDLLNCGRVDKIIITRPAIEAGSQKMGYLPGTKEEKMDPYIRPIKDAMEGVLGKLKFQQLCHDEKIEIAPMSFIRGRSFNSCFVIADEMQNSTVDEMKTLLTRIGKLSKIVCLGDPSQEDHNAKISGLNGLDAARRSFKDDNRVGIVELTNSDIQRSWIVEAADNKM